MAKLHFYFYRILYEKRIEYGQLSLFEKVENDFTLELKDIANQCNCTFLLVYRTPEEQDHLYTSSLPLITLWYYPQQPSKKKMSKIFSLVQTGHSVPNINCGLKKKQYHNSET